MKTSEEILAHIIEGLKGVDEELNRIQLKLANVVPNSLDRMTLIDQARDLVIKKNLLIKLFEWIDS